MRASQESVVGLNPVQFDSSEIALKKYYDPSDANREGMSRRAYRDYVIGVYLNAIEAKYTEFTDALENSERQSGVLSDLLLVALTGATALVDAGDVDELATITAMAASGKAAVDKRLFFDRTLPAIIAAMDADRAIVRADIERRRNLPIEQYSLSQAFDDLQRLQRSGRLSRGITRVSRVAEADRALQQTRLDAIAAACDDITAETAKLNDDFRKLVYDSATTRDARLKMAAEELDIDLKENEAATWPVVRTAFAAQLCDDKRKSEFITNLQTRIQAPAPAPQN